ncbi:MAG: hypothetical protein NT168_09605, partial [Planctomycetota bacterium]|nr:hypothetical protein [Planctomycetota bacterium]
SVSTEIEPIDMRKSFDGPDEILGGYQGHVMADCYSGNMSVVLAPGSISLYCISPAPYSPGQSPGGEGGPSGWMERT